MSETVNKQAIRDLVRIKEELDLVVESLEMMEDKEFMESYHKAKAEVSKRQFESWDEL